VPCPITQTDARAGQKFRAGWLSIGYVSTIEPPLDDLMVIGPTLFLRYATPADAPRLFELGSDPEVTSFFSWGPYTEVGQAEAYIASLPEKRAEGTLLDFLVVSRERGPIGVTGLTDLNRRDRRATIGTWLERESWGTGANRESKALMTAFAFRTLGLERLTALANVTNGRSQRALERIGFRQEGTLRGYHRHGDQVHDVTISGLLKSTWERLELSSVEVEVAGTPPAEWVLG
jgi:[ribosomal protein S5]-alanine N-acetyltransferase